MSKARNLAALVFLTAVAAFGQASGTAQPSLWRGLQTGPYPVGFKSQWTWDGTRTFLPSTDWHGHALHRQTARPIRLSVWYPAVSQKTARPMLYEGYFQADHEPSELRELAQTIDAYDRRSNTNMFNGDQGLFQHLLQTPTAAYRNAPTTTGSFPVVIYSMGQNDYNQENVVLCESLASHGYIVATVPDLGPLPRRSQLLVSDPASYEAQIRDLEFALAEVLRLPSADASKIAAIGHSMGGIYVLLLAMRDDRIGAIVGLDASYMDTLPRFYFQFEDAWYFDVSRIRAPLLSLYRKDDNPDVTMAMLDQLRYSDRTLMAIPKVIHTDFNSYPMITAGNPPVKLDTYAEQHRDQQAAVAGHIFIVEAVLEFLRDSLGGSLAPGGNLMQRCENVSLQGAIADCKTLQSLKAPNEEEFAAIAVKDGPDAATRVYDEAKALAPQEIIIREKVLNRISLEAVYLGRPQNAVKILQLNVHAYPQSSDAYENLAEAYEAEGDKTRALENYKTALALNPDNKDARDGMKKLSTQK